jgi:hypothetical protein
MLSCSRSACLIEDTPGDHGNHAWYTTVSSASPRTWQRARQQWHLWKPGWHTYTRSVAHMRCYIKGDNAYRLSCARAVQWWRWHDRRAVVPRGLHLKCDCAFVYYSRIENSNFRGCYVGGGGWLFNGIRTQLKTYLLLLVNKLTTNVHMFSYVSRVLGMVVYVVGILYFKR